MALVYHFSPEPGTFGCVRDALAGIHDVAAARTWEWLGVALRERPVSLCVVDLASISLAQGGCEELVALRRRVRTQNLVAWPQSVGRLRLLQPVQGT